MKAIWSGVLRVLEVPLVWWIIDCAVAAYVLRSYVGYFWSVFSVCLVFTRMIEGAIRRGINGTKIVAVGPK